uniref:Zinc-ribbon domain-containing protein n=1 Tax=Promethearchaeum syntrophicum TaxID=2594042 RepID=A0A5B9DF85_9ARCH|nr:zinc ribbon domain-containing protein [Candidatus Prometheoarchaeum syntrophicum]QEE17772.1 hypothetical protein DSAG12_03610 [Candidatus Prometheoarchaeum syntrophicum]
MDKSNEKLKEQKKLEKQTEKEKSRLRKQMDNISWKMNNLAKKIVEKEKKHDQDEFKILSHKLEQEIKKYSELEQEYKKYTQDFTVEEVNKLADLHELEFPRNHEINNEDLVKIQCILCGHSWESTFLYESLKVPMWDKGKWCRIEKERDKYLQDHIPQVLKHAQGSQKGDKWIDKINEFGDVLEDYFGNVLNGGRENYGERITEEKTIVDYFIEEYKEYRDESAYKIFLENNHRNYKTIIEEIFGNKVYKLYQKHYSKILDNYKSDHEIVEIQPMLHALNLIIPSSKMDEQIQVFLYCKHCGKKIDQDSKFCKYCGKSL